MRKKYLISIATSECIYDNHFELTDDELESLKEFFEFMYDYYYGAISVYIKPMKRGLKNEMESIWRPQGPYMRLIKGRK